MTILETKVLNPPGVAPKDIPAYALTPDDWAAEALRRAADYAGMPEGAWFLVEARRYLALHKRIQELEVKANGRAET